MNLSPIVIPHTEGAGRQAVRQGEGDLVERTHHNRMRTENYTGKKSKSYRVVAKCVRDHREAHQKNPVSLVDALGEGSAREEVTRRRSW